MTAWGEMLLMDVGGNYIKYARTGGDGKLRPETFGELPSRAEEGPEEILSVFRQVIAEAKKEGVPERCAVSIPDPFDYETGTFRMKHKFTSVYGKSLRPLFAEEGMEVSFVQDTVAYMLGTSTEGIFEGASCPCLITLGTGVGFALMREGKVQVNRGRIPVPILWNAPYEEGITEDYVSTRAIQARYLPGYTVREIAARARSGDPQARAAFRETGMHLARILNRVTKEQGCDRIVLGGQISKSADLLELRTEVPWILAANLDAPALHGLNVWQRMGQERCLRIVDAPEEKA